MRRSKKVFAELLAAPLMFPREGGREKVPRKYHPPSRTSPAGRDSMMRASSCKRPSLAVHATEGRRASAAPRRRDGREAKSTRLRPAPRSRRAPGPKPVLHRRILRALGQGPCYTKELASRVHASDFWTREVLKQLETRGLVRSWTFAQADRGGRNLTVHAWRLTTGEERRHGKEDPNATAHASALLSKMLRGQLSRVERMNELLAAEAERDREARLSSS